MAINDFKNIENINLNLDSTAQLVESKDLKIFKTGAKNITDFGMSKNDVIEFRVYDISNNLLEQTGGIKVKYIHKDNLPKYLKSDIDTITQEKIFEIDVEKLVREAGYGNGEFKVSFNFLKNYVGNEDKKQRVWIHEISPSRNEIRVMPLLGNDTENNKKIQHRYNGFINKTSELRELVGIIKNTIDFIETQISDLIDKYFVNKYGQFWLDLVIKEFKFGNEVTYTKFKQKVFNDFKKSVNYQLEGKEFNIEASNYGKISKNTFDMDEFYSTEEIESMLHSRLHESIDYNSKSLTMYDIPQVIKDYTKTKVDSQLLQSLMNTNYATKSNLTQNNKLGTLKKENVLIDIKPQPTTSVIVPPIQPQPQPQPIIEPTPIYNGGGGGGGSVREDIGKSWDTKYDNAADNQAFK
jgi:hypothetical protein